MDKKKSLFKRLVDKISKLFNRKVVVPKPRKYRKKKKVIIRKKSG